MAHRTESAPRAWIERLSLGGAAVVLACLAGVAAVVLVAAIHRLPARVGGVFNDGWNAFAAERAFGEGPLYPRPSSLVSNNYPPLSYYVVGGVGLLLGDHVVAGRLVSLASLGAVVLLLGRIVSRTTRSRLLAAWAAAFFLVFVALRYPAYVVINDPQWLANACMTGGLLLFLSSSRGTRGLLATCLLLLVGGLVKHNAPGIPLAITLWLLWHDRAGLRVWLVASASALAIAALVLYATFDRDVFLGIFATPRLYSLEYAWPKLELWSPPLLPFLAASVVLGVLAPRDPVTRLVGLYVVVAGIWGAVALGGAGVNSSVLFDFVIAATVASALAISRLAERAHARGFPADAVRAGALVLLSLPLLVSAPGAITQARSGMNLLPLMEAVTEADVAFLAAREGPALCDQPDLCYWAGKPFEVDWFNTIQRIRTGDLDPDVLADLFEQEYFAVLLLKAVSALPESVREQIQLHYEVVRRKPGWVFMVPRTGDADP